MNLTDICLKNQVFAWMLMFGTILFGIVSVTRIGVSQFPDVDNPTVSVSVSWPGASPEDVETGLINPIEDAMSQVTGVLTLTSSASTGSARVTATFDLSRNIDLALQDTQAKIAQVQRSLPTSAMAPTVSKSNPDDQPIITLGVYGPYSRALLADVARYQVEDMLETVPGVGQVQLMGYVDRNVRIWVDAEKLVATGVTVNDITSAIKTQHVTMPGGELDNGGLAFDVRVIGEAADLTTLRNIVVRAGGLNPVRLQDVALVQDGFQDINNVARFNGQPVQAMGILKQPGSNAVGVAKAVQASISNLQKTLPDGMKIEVVFDTTQFISESVDEIGIELGLAVILTAMVCWLFLGSLSSTMNVLFAIPMSLLGTIAVLYFCGFTLNTFTLLGLSLAVGLVVDDAVMVMENIFRHAEMGKDRVRAAGEGTKEITFAALAATLAVIAIFMPVAFMSGMIGKFFLQFGVTLSVAVAISYVEAISLAPARCAQMLRTSTHESRGVVGRLADKGFEKLAAAYAWALERSLRWPWAVLGLAVAVLAAAGYVTTKIPQEFVPSQDQSRLMVSMKTAVGANLASTDVLARRAEAFLMSRPEVIDVVSNVSGGSANFQVTMVDPKQRVLTQQAFSTVIRNELNKYPGVKAAVRDLSQQGFGGSKGFPVEFSVRGSDWNTLVSLATKMQEQVASSGVITDVSSDYQLGSPELVVTPDRARATDLGINVSDIANTVSAMVGGLVVGQYSNAGRRMDMNLRLTASQRSRPEDLGLLRMRTPNGTLVPLSSVVATTQQAELQQINHADRERAITITGNIAPGHAQNEALAFVQGLTTGLPPGYRVVLSGQSSQFGDAMSSLLFALVVGILVAYMVLASQFNSFLHPVTVLTILPLSIAGAMFALLIAGRTLNVFSMIGLLLLMGIVKKNSIILVDYATEIRHKENLDARTAMLKAGPIRLRPILMTAVATMMAAVPSALGLGPGKETRGPMADAVIGGLILSTALSLLVVPAFYVVADRLRGKKAATAHEPTPSVEHAQ
ncbi:MAG TPA: efflux RND transporter permease subunit [Polyangiaceae bacterium]|nr:efflux RND transporter permease subunit [Polyangiaceae bacterium]